MVMLPALLPCYSGCQASRLTHMLFVFFPAGAPYTCLRSRELKNAYCRWALAKPHIRLNTRRMPKKRFVLPYLVSSIEIGFIIVAPLDIVDLAKTSTNSSAHFGNLQPLFSIWKAQQQVCFQGGKLIARKR